MQVNLGMSIADDTKLHARHPCHLAAKEPPIHPGWVAVLPAQACQLACKSQLLKSWLKKQSIVLQEHRPARAYGLAAAPACPDLSQCTGRPGARA